MLIITKHYFHTIIDSYVDKPYAHLQTRGVQDPDWCPTFPMTEDVCTNIQNYLDVFPHMAQIMLDLVTTAKKREDDYWDEDYEELMTLKSRRVGRPSTPMTGELLVVRRRWCETVTRWEVLLFLEESFRWSAYGVRYGMSLIVI